METSNNIVSKLTNENVSISLEGMQNYQYRQSGKINLSSEINRVNKDLDIISTTNLIKIYTGLKILDIENFNSYRNHLKCKFELFFKYNKNEFEKNNIELNNDFSFDISILNSESDTVHINKSVIDKNTEDDVRLLYRVSCILDIPNNSEFSPFNILIIPFDIHLDNIFIHRGCEVKIEPLEYENFYIDNYKYIESIEGYYSVQSDLKLNESSNNIEIKKDVRINYAFYTANSTWIENIIKYLLLPILLSNFLLIFADIDDGEYSNLFATLVLADIALLFTIPETGNTTISEKCINANIIVKIIVGLLRIKAFPFDTVSLSDLYAALIVLIIGVGTFGRSIADYTDVNIPDDDIRKQSLNQTAYFYTQGAAFGRQVFGFDIFGSTYSRFDDAVKSSSLSEWYMFFIINIFLFTLLSYFIYKSYIKYLEIKGYFEKNFKEFNIRKETTYKSKYK